MRLRSVHGLACIVCVAALARPLRAAEPDASTSSASPAPNRTEAEARYRRALEIFNEGNYDAALLELRRAYELAPSYRILYNIALVNVQLADYASALDAFERYLADGGAQVPEARAAEIKAEIARLGARVASVTIEVDVAGADVSVDDLSVGKAPLAKPLRLNAGRRRISIAAEGRLPQSRVIELAGGDNANLQFKLDTPAAEPAPAVPAPPPPPAPVAPPPPPPRPEPESSTPWVPWAITGVLTATAVTTGILALRAHSKEEDLENRFGVDRAELDDQHSEVKRWALITDIAAGGAAVAAGVALYITLSSHRSAEAAPEGTATLLLGPTRVGARLSF